MAESEPILLTSTAFAPGGALPQKYWGTGDRPSPPLTWSGIPAAARSLAIVMTERGLVPAVRWIVFDIAPTVTELPEGLAPGARAPGGGKQGYGGYAAPHPQTRTELAFEIHALDALLGLGAGTAHHKIQHALRGRTLALGELTCWAEGEPPVRAR